MLTALGSAPAALLVAAGVYRVSAAVLRLVLIDGTSRTPGCVSIGETWRTNRLLLASPPRGSLYLALVPNG